LQESLEEVESRTRRRDILVDDQVMFEFYRERVPADILNLASFEHWRKEAEKSEPKLLWMDESLLAQRQLEEDTGAQFPDHLEWQGTRFPLRYHFEPGHVEDGVSVTVPVSILHQVPAHRFEWLVPGMLRDKCIALVKGLPKATRRHFVPVPTFVDRALIGLKAGDVPLTEALGFQLQRQSGVKIGDDQWQSENIEDIYRLNIRLIDEDGKLLEMSRDLAALKAKYRGRVSHTVQQSSGSGIERENLAGWDFETLPEVYDIRQQGLTIRTYPALVCSGQRIDLKLLDNPSTAANCTQLGLIKLYQLAYPQGVKYLRKELLKGQDLKLKAAGLPGREVLVADLIDAAYQRALMTESPVPRTKADFERYLAAGRGNIVSSANELEQLLLGWLPLLVDIQRTLKQLGLAVVKAAPDINRQLVFLFQKHFFAEVPEQWLQQYQRYLKALQARLEKLPGQPQKDREYVQLLEKLENKPGDIGDRWQDFSRSLQDEIWQYRFMLQELRVSLFAQQLRTLFPVSEKRILSQWDTLEQAIAGR
jgi:ATP-dependent helicase HrpA